MSSAWALGRGQGPGHSGQAPLETSEQAGTLGQRCLFSLCFRISVTRCHWEKNLLFLSLQHLLVAKQIPWVTMWAQNLCRTARNLLHPIVKVKNEIIPLTCHYFAQSFHYWMVMAQNVILTYLWEYKWVLHISPPREWEGRKRVLGSLRLILLWVNDCGEAGGTNQQCPLLLEKWCFRQVKTILI